MKNKFLSNRTVQLAFGSAIFILLAMGAFSYRSMVVSNESDRLVAHTHEILDHLQSLDLGMVSVSAAVRGFALTGKESYLEIYRAAKLSVLQNAEVVRAMTADNPEQQRRLADLERLAAARLQRADTVIELRRSKGIEAAAALIASAPGE